MLAEVSLVLSFFQEGSLQRIILTFFCFETSVLIRQSGVLHLALVRWPPMFTSRFTAVLLLSSFSHRLLHLARFFSVASTTYSQKWPWASYWKPLCQASKGSPISHCQSRWAAFFRAGGKGKCCGAVTERRASWAEQWLAPAAQSWRCTLIRFISAHLTDVGFMVSVHLLNYFGSLADCLSWGVLKGSPGIENKPLSVSFNFILFLESLRPSVWSIWPTVPFLLHMNPGTSL